MAGPTQQTQQQKEEQARQRTDARKSADALRRDAKQDQKKLVAAHERSEASRARKESMLTSVVRSAQQAIQNKIASVRRASSPQQNVDAEAEALRKQQGLQKASGGAQLQSRLGQLGTDNGTGIEQTEPKLSMEQKRELRVKYIREQKQQLKQVQIEEHVPLHQFLNQYRVVQGSGRPNMRTLTEQGLSLDEIKRVFEAYVISFFHEISLAAGYLVRAYTQWVKGGHREEGRAPIGMFGEIVRQMQFSRGPAVFDDSDADGNKKKKLGLVSTTEQAGKASASA